MRSIFAGVPFPKNFRSICQTVLRRLFRVYGHIYASHFDQICALGIEGASFDFLFLAFVRTRLIEALNSPHSSTAHLNTNYRHFLLFVTEFQLVDKKELLPLAEFNDAILAEEKK